MAAIPRANQLVGGELRIDGRVDRHRVGKLFRALVRSGHYLDGIFRGLLYRRHRVQAVRTTQRSPRILPVKGSRSLHNPGRDLHGLPGTYDRIHRIEFNDRRGDHIHLHRSRITARTVRSNADECSGILSNEYRTEEFTGGLQPRSVDPLTRCKWKITDIKGGGPYEKGISLTVGVLLRVERQR